MSKHHLVTTSADQRITANARLLEQERRISVGADPEISKAERAKRRAVGKRQRAARRASR